MADNLEQAILITFDQTGAAGPSLKEQALAFTTEFKHRADCWAACVEHFSCTQYGEVRFWCLQTLLETVRFGYANMAIASKSSIKQALLTWMGSESDLAPFLKNKLAQILVYIVQVEYPEQWPSFFQDLLALLPQGAHVVEMFARILMAIDDDVISLDIPRSQEESRRSMHLKDAMREYCIQELAEAWFQLVTMYREQQPELAAMVLEAVKRYINWIDINLVANSRFISLLFTLPSSPSHALQGAACGCIIEILAKRMDSLHKLKLIQQLGIVGDLYLYSDADLFQRLGEANTLYGDLYGDLLVCRSWVGGLPPQRGGEEADEELAEKYAGLLATLATELLECWKRAENGVMSIHAVGLEVDPEAMAEAQEATNSALGLLSDLFPAVISSLHSPTDCVAMAMMPFLLAYMQRVKRMQPVPEQHMQHARLTLAGLLKCAMYPMDMDPDDDSPQYVEEVEEAVAEKRKEVFTLLRHIAKMSFHEATSFIGAKLKEVIVNHQATFQDVEVVVVLVHQIGEGAAEEYTKSGHGVLGQMAAALMQAGTSLPHAGNRLVAVAVLEVFVRYCKVIQVQPELAPAVLGALLDKRGMGHASMPVSTRACYLFQRLIRQLRGNLSTLLETILAGVEPHLARIAATPLAQTTQAAGQGGGPKGAYGKDKTLANAYMDDRMYAFEAVGLLLGGEDLSAERQVACVQGMLGPLVQQIEGNTQPAAKGGTNEALMVQHALVAVANLSKGFNHHTVTATRPMIGEMMLRVLDVAIRIPVAAPRHKAMRARVAALIHRYVEVLGTSLLPYTQQALESLMYEGMDAQDTGDVLSLMVQLICRFKESMLTICDRALGPQLETVFTLLPSTWDWSGATGTGAQSIAVAQANGTQATGSAEELREKAEMQRSYYALLHAACHNNLTTALSHLRSPSFEQCMQSLVAGAATHVDPAVRKLCIQCLGQLVAQWLPVKDGATQEAFSGFQAWTLTKVAGEACLGGIVLGALDLQDAAVSSLLGEVAAVLLLIYHRCGESLISNMQAAGLPQQLFEQLALAIRSAKEAKELKASVKTLMQQLRTAQGQGR